MNTKFARLQKGRIEYAPNIIKTSHGISVNPSETTLLASGWKRVVDIPPEVEKGMRAVQSAWRIEGDEIVCEYTLVPDGVTGKRVFSKLKILSALQAIGQWDNVKAWLQANGYYDIYLAAQTFVENNPLFIAGCTALKKNLNIDESVIESVLAESIAD